MRYLPKNITKQLLWDLYINQNKSTKDAGEEIGKSRVQFGRYLKRFGIPARPFSTKGLRPRLGAKLSEESKDKIRQKAIGRKIPLEVRKKMGSKKEKNASWKGGVTPLHKLIRHLPAYELWIKSVFMRDRWTCQDCGKVGGDIHAHHNIITFADIMQQNQIDSVEKAVQCEMLWNIENGITLCKKCHKNRHRKP